MAEFTPGPWEFKSGYDNMLNANFEDDGISGTIRGDGWNIARIWRMPNHECNARLIAAAPELLAALEAITEHLAESHATEKDADHYGDDPEECSYCKSIEAAQAAIKKARGL